MSGFTAGSSHAVLLEVPGRVLSNGQPTIFFRPLLCADIRGTGATA
jgi:hypothetical protein